MWGIVHGLAITAVSQNNALANVANWRPVRVWSSLLQIFRAITTHVRLPRAPFIDPRFSRCSISFYDRLAASALRSATPADPATQQNRSRVRDPARDAGWTVMRCSLSHLRTERCICSDQSGPTTIAIMTLCNMALEPHCAEQSTNLGVCAKPFDRAWAPKSLTRLLALCVNPALVTR